MGLTITPAITLQAERLTYPGMLPREILIWRCWLRLHEREYSSFDYNERVGPGYDPGPAYADNIRLMAIANSQKRIDVVAWQGSQPELIEVKDRAGASAIGQLMAYYPLWNAAHQDLPRANMRMVTNRIQTGIDISCKYHGIALDVIPCDFSSLARDRRAAPLMPRQAKGLVVL